MSEQDEKMRDEFESWFNREGRFMTSNDFSLCIAVWKSCCSQFDLSHQADREELASAKILLEVQKREIEQKNDSLRQLHHIMADCILEFEQQLSAMTKRAEDAEEALKPKPPREGIYPWAVELEPTANHARYWQEGARKVESHHEALMCVDQAVNSWKNACYAYAEKNCILEQRIRESQEQEPVCYVPIENLKDVGGVTKLKDSFACYLGKEGELCVERGYGIPCFGDDAPLYAQPIIPPSLEELQRDLAGQKELTELYKHDYAKSLCENDDLRGERERLGRKLAEQQGQMKKMRRAICVAINKIAGFTSEAVIPVLEDALETIGESAELNKLLSEARSKAVPEDFEPLEVVRYWVDAYSTDPFNLGGGMIVKLLQEYLQLRLSASPTYKE